MAANTSYAVEIEVAGAWIDITGYVDTVSLPLRAETGDGAETSDASGKLYLDLLNADQRFTPGNTLSPYYPYLTTGQRIRVRDRIDSLTMVIDLFTGYIQFPEISAWTASTATAPRDQRITFTALDRLAWLDRGRPFLSTLGEHVLSSGQSAGLLVGLWPLVASRGYEAYGPSQTTLTESHTLVTNTIPTPFASIVQTGSSVCADDVATTRLTPGLSSGSVVDTIFLDTVISDIAVSNTTFACSFWINFEDVHSNALQWYAAYHDPVLDEDVDSISITRSAGTWSFNAIFGGSAFSSTINALPTYKWSLVTLRITLPSGLAECWVNESTPVTGTIAPGPIPSSTTINRLQLGLNQQGNLAYVQCYVGDFTLAQHLAQYQMGLLGLERQLTGQRVRTIAAYAGVPSTELNGVDDGSSYMTRASLAGKSPLTALTEASDTEQGRLYADGSGALVFAGRKRLYNI